MVWCGLKTRADIAKILCEVFPVTHLVALGKELRLTGASFPQLKNGLKCNFPVTWLDVVFIPKLLCNILVNIGSNSYDQN